MYVAELFSLVSTYLTPPQVFFLNFTQDFDVRNIIYAINNLD